MLVNPIVRRANPSGFRSLEKVDATSRNSPVMIQQSGGACVPSPLPSNNVKNRANANRTGDTGYNQTAAQQRGQGSQRSSASGTSREDGQSFGSGSGGGSSRTASSGASDVDRDFQNRQRGGSQSERFSSFQRSGAGGDRSSGARRGGVRRR